MKIKHLIIIAIVALVAIANILVAQQVKNQRNMLTIDNVTSFVAEGEDGEGGFLVLGRKGCILPTLYNNYLSRWKNRLLSIW